MSRVWFKALDLLVWPYMVAGWGVLVALEWLDERTDPGWH